MPFCARDKALAVRLAERIAELGGVAKHDCLLAVHKDTDSAGVIEPLTAAFGRIAEFAITDEMIVEREQHAYAANLMWKRTVNHIADMNESQPFLWVEPDATPTKASWVDEIAAAYAACGKAFLHDLVKTPRGKSNSGCGVYPSKVRDYTSRLWELADVSWDILLYEDFAPHTAYTQLIQDIGFLADGKTLPTFPDQASLSIIRPEAVLFHRCKDFSLTDRLRGEPAALASAPAKSGDEVSAVPHVTPAQPPTPNDRDELLTRIARLEALLEKAIPKNTPGFVVNESEQSILRRHAGKPPAKRKTKRHVSPERRAQLSKILAVARDAKKAAAK